MSVFAPRSRPTSLRPFHATQDSVCHASSGTFPYPMFVMRVKDFMSLVYASPHQELVAKGVVHKFDSRRRATWRCLG